MEPDVPSPAGAPRPDAGRADWRSLSHLRDRVEAAAREIERLRAENAALAKRVLDLQDHRESAPSFAFGEAGDDPDALRKKVQGFIDTIDRLLEADAPEQTPDADTGR